MQSECRRWLRRRHRTARLQSRRNRPNILRIGTHADCHSAAHASISEIHNRTPHQPVAPVDSQRNPGWQQILQAHAEGALAAEQERTLFTRPRPTFELYDLKVDPGELKDLSGDRTYAGKHCTRR